MKKNILYLNRAFFNANIFIIIIILLLFVYASTGCERVDDPHETTQSVTGSAVAPPVATDQGKQLPYKMTAAFGSGWATGQDGAFNDMTANEIEKITGIEIENIPLGETFEDMYNKQNIMLSSGDYPEIMRFHGANAVIARKYIKEGALIPLDSLIESHGRNISTMMGGSLLNKMRNLEDNKIYLLPSFYGFNVDEGYFCMNIKYDLLKQLDASVADGTGSITPEKYYELLKAFKEKFPKIGGMQSIPLTFSQNQKGFDGGLGFLCIMKAAYGIRSFSEDEDHNLKIDIKDPQYLNMLTFLAKLSREGLIDEEWPLLKYQTYIEKLQQGNVFSTTGAWFEMLNGPNPVFNQMDPTGYSQYMPFVIADKGVVNPPLFENGEKGNGGSIGITRNCKDPEKAMSFLDFCASPDGNFLNLWGPEGILWDVVDGKRMIKNEYHYDYKNNTNEFWKKHRIRLWNILNTQDRIIEKMRFSDGTTFEVVPKSANPTGNELLYEWQRQKLRVEIDTSYNSDFYTGILPPAGSKEALIDQKFSDIKEKRLFKIILDSKNDSEVREGLSKLISDADELGIETFEKYITLKYKENLKK